MSQTTEIQIQNQNGLSFRTKLNQMLSALNTNFAGTTAPTITEAYMGWLDTSVTPNVLRRRNSSDTAWELAPVVEGEVVAASAKTVPVDADLLPLLDSASSFSLKKLTWANIKATLFSAVTMTGLLKFAAGANIVSASTVNLSTATGNTVHITGTTTISAWTMSAGQTMDIIFDGVLTLTHHTTNNNLPGGLDIITEAGDRARYYYDGTTVFCLGFFPSAGNIITSNRTLLVPSQYASIDAAMAYLSKFNITNNATVTIQVADGTYNITQPISLYHRDGKQIQIIGNVTTPANCIISYTGTGAFVASGSSTTVGLINGFKITSTHWTSHGVWNSIGGSGIAAILGATIYVGAKVLIDKCYYGVRAAEGGQVYVDPAGITVTESGDGGFFAFMGGTIECINSISNTAADSANGLGFGFIAENGGTMRADNADATGNQISGFFVNLGGSMWASSSTSTSNGRHGYEIERGSAAEIRNAVANSNTVFGMYVANNSYVLKTGLSGAGNGSGLTGFGTNGILG